MKPRVIGVANQKGGVGKTTTAVNLAAGLALAGAPTILLDMDPQGNATSGLGIDPKSLRRGIYHALIGMADLDQLLHPVPDIDLLTVIPANTALFGAEVELVDAIAREYRLKEALTRLSAAPRFIIIDCPPSLGLLTVNALTAADAVLIPLQCEYYALEGLTQLLRTIQLIQRRLNPELAIESIVLTMFDRRNNLSHQVAADARAHFKDLVLDFEIPRNVRLSESPSFGRSIHQYDRSSRGARAYKRLADTLMRRHAKDLISKVSP